MRRALRLLTTARSGIRHGSHARARSTLPPALARPSGRWCPSSGAAAAGQGGPFQPCAAGARASRSRATPSSRCCPISRPCYAAPDSALAAVRRAPGGGGDRPSAIARSVQPRSASTTDRPAGADAQPGARDRAARVVAGMRPATAVSSRPRLRHPPRYATWSCVKRAIHIERHTGRASLERPQRSRTALRGLSTRRTTGRPAGARRRHRTCARPRSFSN